jgi:hypothetical protein
MIGLLVACGPQQFTGDELGLCGATDCGDENAVGVLSADGFRVEWEWYDPWDGGTCARVRVVNTGRPVVWWTIDLTMSEPFGDVTHRDPADGMFLSGDVLSLSPAESGALDRGGRATYYYCAEPRSWPTSMVVEAVSEDGVEDPTGPEAFGTLVDRGGDVGLTWTRRSDDCIDLTLVNLTSQVLTAWDLRAALSAPSALTGGAGFFPVVEGGDDLRLRPTAVSGDVEPHGAVSGRVCLADPVDLSDLRASYTLSAPADPDPVDPDPVDPDPDPTDDTPPFVRNIKGQLIQNDTEIEISFVTDEPATGLVCDSQLRCEWTQTDGTSHRVELPYRADVYTIRVTDRSGNSREIGPIQF